MIRFLARVCLPVFPLLTAVAVLTSGCHSSSHAPARSERLVGESLILIGEEPASLAFLPTPGTAITVRGGYQAGQGVTDYVVGKDYAVDMAAGTIRRLPGSRIPDFRTNVLYGQKQFDHSKFPGFGNTRFFAFADYTHPATAWPVQSSQIARLPKSVAKLKAGGDFKLVAYGDSITAGGDATRPEWIFWNRWAESLQAKHPSARIKAVNGATGGDSSVQGLQRLQVKVLAEKPDLVLVGFGMNDHNKGGVPLPQFMANLKEIIARIRSETGAEVVLFSAFPPNPEWRHSSHRMEAYAGATEVVARETGCAFADVFNNWQAFSTRKKPEDLLGNNINHPNDFGHWMYFRVLEATGL